MWFSLFKNIVEVSRMFVKYQKFSQQNYKYFEGQLDEHPVWIAGYNNRNPYLSLKIKWHFWQYGNHGRLSGVRGHVDFNVFHGTQKELEELCVFYEPVFSFT